MWQAPLITILTRSMPEESILDTCKMQGGGAANGAQQGGCVFDVVAMCMGCQIVGGS